MWLIYSQADDTHNYDVEIIVQLMRRIIYNYVKMPFVVKVGDNIFDNFSVDCSSKAVFRCFKGIDHEK